MNNTLRTAGFFSITLLFAYIVFISCQKKPSELTNNQLGNDEILAATNSYIGKESCIKCHEQAYHHWQDSDHDMAMKKATDKSVRGNFNDTEVKIDGVQYRFHQKDSAYYATVKEIDGSENTYKIAYTFGWAPLQQYMVEFPGGKVQVMRASWDTEKKKWFHQYAGDKIQPNDWLHWTGNSQNWQNMCASCHSTNLKKNFNEQDWTYHTTFSEINVSCESCHGAGKQHVEAMEKGESYSTGHFVDFQQQEVQLSVCGSCHARRTMMTENSNPQPEMMQSFVPNLLTTENYHADGQIRDEDYVLSSFMSSKMHQNNVMCTNCHDPHTSKVKTLTNALCLQCHDKSYDSKLHHFHEKETKGAQCINCHMDGAVYMGNDYRRDHSFRVPRPDQSVKFGTPNACNSCHTEKSVKWAADKVEEWYGKDRAYHFSDDLIPGSHMDASSAPHLIKLFKDTTQNAIVRATALHYLSYLPEQAVPYLQKGVLDKEGLVRYAAYTRSLDYPQLRQQAAFWKGLTDPLRTVRVVAYRAVMDVPAQQRPTNFASAFNQGKKEYEEYLAANADMVAGQINKGEYHQRLNETEQAIAAYERALKLDSVLVLPRINLSLLYSGMGDNKKAKYMLQQAITQDADNDLSYYYLSLLYAEEGQYKEAAGAVQQAINLNDNDPTYYYNYVAMLLKLQNMKKAQEVTYSALQKWPNNQRIQSLLPYLRQ
ncbi:multiheme c-type cytochrome [Limibacter armeniacum]|uniref:multiheme c-type cytochrome n=1 Tax=Limibacter armeniacum TaxID=466084 RepID=UPI002FE5F70C